MRVLIVITICILALSVNAFSQTVEAKRPYLIVDTTKVEPQITHPLQTIKFFASGAETGDTVSFFETTEMPGYRTNWHRHPNAEETFFVLEGVLTVKVGDETHHLPAGSYIFIARGTPHAQGNLTDKPTRFLTTVTPGGIEAFFKERSEVLKKHKPGDKEYDELMRPIIEKNKIWLEVLGPWPADKTEVIGKLSHRSC